MTREEYLEKLRFMESMYHSKNTSFEVAKQFSEHIQVFRNLIDQFSDLKIKYESQLSANRTLVTLNDELIAENDALKESGLIVGQYGETTVKPTKDDPINPIYYNDTKITPWDVIDDWGLDFYLGSAMKYIKRAGKKEGNSTVQDLLKVRRYIEKEIELADKEANQ